MSSHMAVTFAALLAFIAFCGLVFAWMALDKHDRGLALLLTLGSAALGGGSYLEFTQPDSLYGNVVGAEFILLTLGCLWMAIDEVKVLPTVADWRRERWFNFAGYLGLGLICGGVAACQYLYVV